MSVPAVATDVKACGYTDVTGARSEKEGIIRTASIVDQFEAHGSVPDRALVEHLASLPKEAS